jgi:hypothetical protein
VKSKKIIVVWGCAALILLVAGMAVTLALLLKQSPSFRQGVLAKVERNIYEATGSRLTVRDFNLGFFPLRLDLYGVVARGSEPQFGEPLLRADHVGAGIEIGSLGGRPWSLHDVVVDHPVIRLVVSQAGESNLPQPETNRRKTANVYDLAIRELQLRGAEVEGNERKIQFDAELHNLHSTAEFDGNAKRYRGVLNYTEGTIQYDHYAPMAHSLELSFDAAPAKFAVDHLVLVAGKSRVAATGSVENYNDPTVQATYDIQLATNDATTLLPNASLPAGVVHAVGSLNYRRDSGRPMLDAIDAGPSYGSKRFWRPIQARHR